MLTIRLQRVGNKNNAAFRIVLAEKHRAVKKQVVELLGHYNPRTKEFAVKDRGRVNYWIDQHVELSGTVHNLFVNHEIIKADKIKVWKPKKKESVSDSSPSTDDKTVNQEQSTNEDGAVEKKDSSVEDGVDKTESTVEKLEEKPENNSENSVNKEQGADV